MPTFTTDGGPLNVPFVTEDFRNKPTSKIISSFIRVCFSSLQHLSIIPGVPITPNFHLFHQFSFHFFYSEPLGARERWLGPRGSHTLNTPVTQNWCSHLTSFLFPASILACFMHSECNFLTLLLQVRESIDWKYFVTINIDALASQGNTLSHFSPSVTFSSLSLSSLSHHFLLTSSFIITSWSLLIELTWRETFFTHQLYFSILISLFLFQLSIPSPSCCNLFHSWRGLQHQPEKFCFSIHFQGSCFVMTFHLLLSPNVNMNRCWGISTFVGKPQKLVWE